MQKFNKGGYNPETSSIGVQFNDKHYSRIAVMESAKKKVFSQMGDRLTQPKHFGDKIVKYHEIPILDRRNINDQGIDAAGVTMNKTEWYGWDAGNVRSTFATEALAKAALTAGTVARIQSGEGNLYGSSKDFSVQIGAFPSLTEEGGMVNRVGMKRETLEANVEEFGFYMSFSKRSLEMDTEVGLLSRYSKSIGVAQGEIREAQIRNGLITAGMVNTTYAGTATNNATVDDTSIVNFQDLRQLDLALKDARVPKSTKIITGSTKIDTKTVGKARYMYFGSELLATLEDMTHGGRDLWVPVEMYADAGTIAEGEVGKIGQWRFIEVDEDMPYFYGEGAPTTNTNEVHRDGAGKVTVFPMLFVGDESFATVGFAGDSSKVTTIMPKADAHNDVYGKKGAVSVSWYFGLMVLRQERLRVLKTAAKM